MGEIFEFQSNFFLKFSAYLQHCVGALVDEAFL